MKHLFSLVESLTESPELCRERKHEWASLSLGTQNNHCGISGCVLSSRTQGVKAFMVFSKGPTTQEESGVPSPTEYASSSKLAPSAER